MKLKLALIPALALCAASVSTANAQVSYTSLAGAEYTQNFNTLLASGNATWTQNAPQDTTNGLRGWYAFRGTEDNANVPTLFAGAGTLQTGRVYAFGTGTDSDRALGSVGAGAIDDFVSAVRLRNASTVFAITQVAVRYRGEQWRHANGGVQSIEVGYRVADAGTVPAGTILLQDNANQSGFTTVSALAFNSPLINGTAVGAGVDGNTNFVNIAATVDVSVEAGRDLYFRFRDVDHAANDHGLGVDDFAFRAAEQVLPAGRTANFATSVAIGGDSRILVNGTVNINSTTATVPAGVGGVFVNTGGVFNLGAGSFLNVAGDVTVNGGTLAVAGAITGPGTVSVTGGTAFGTGNLGNVALSGAGVVSPGANPGDIATLSGGDFAWEGGSLFFDLPVTGTIADRLALSGAFTKIGAGQRTFDFNGTGGLLTGRTFTLISFDSTDFLASDFAATNLPTGISGDFQIVGSELQFVYGGIVAVPEPGTLPMVFGVGCWVLGAAVTRRRRL